MAKQTTVVAEETVQPARRGRPAVKTAAKAAKTITYPSKMAHATAVFQRMHERPRSEILQAFQKECGLTEKGSATYYFLIQKKEVEAEAHA